MAEALAASGFLVVAPEFAESLSSPDTTPPYSRPGAPAPANPSAGRDQIVNAVLSDIVGGRFGINSDGNVGVSKIAIVGQSAGAGTATSTPGRFARVAIAGFRPPPLEDSASLSALLRDPLLIIASEGDGVISLFPKEAGRFGPSPGIKAAVDTLPTSVARFSSPREFLGQVITSSSAAAAASASPESASVLQLRTAFVAYEQSTSGDATASGGAGWTAASSSGSGAFFYDASYSSPAVLPCHISFLSSRTNDAMVDVLSPLLPVARLLNVPVLDFDVYATTRDSDAVAADLVPAVVAWLARVTSSE